jgi:hypothetical protein
LVRRYRFVLVTSVGPGRRPRASGRVRRYLGAIAELCKEGYDSGDDRVVELALPLLPANRRKEVATITN